MLYLLLLVVLFTFALFKGESNIALIILIMFISAILLTYSKLFRNTLKDFF